MRCSERVYCVCHKRNGRKNMSRGGETKSFSRKKIQLLPIEAGIVLARLSDV